MKKLWNKLTMLGITILGMMHSTMSLAAVQGVDPTTFDSGKSTNATTYVTNFGNNVLSMVSTGASVIAVIILIVLGIKYMMGSAEEKAEYKKTLLPYFIGAIFVFGAGVICSVIFNIAGTNWAE